MTGPGVFVTALTRINNEGRSVAECTVRIGAVTVRHVKLLRTDQEPGGLGIGFPRRYEKGTGQLLDVVQVDTSLRRQILAAVLAAYREASA